MKRKIIEIDANKCNGCGECMPNCPEGALQMIDGKARLVSDLFCDGLGACIGHCPEGAITVVEREAEPYDERKVMANIIKQGDGAIKAHLTHLRDHGEMGYLKQAIEYLSENGKNVQEIMHGTQEGKALPCGCPGSRVVDHTVKPSSQHDGPQQSELRQWPVQLHLVSPMASYFRGRDVVLAADCTAYAIGDFHGRFLAGRSLAIACPKLDSRLDSYSQKITSLIDDAKINTLTVVTMEVPCCGGLLMIAKEAAGKSKRKIPIKSVVVGVNGNILADEWI